MPQPALGGDCSVAVGVVLTVAFAHIIKKIKRVSTEMSEVERTLEGLYLILTTMAPVKLDLGVKKHPGAVCHVTWLCSLSWTPSRISISPVY
ncbi:hypothetical protein K435DRAFT_383472 [Dendrothele bispora CBS 962.96]|uniref:Uncharacterized protein n=1 Tax=Dendrothele bispora (strain CBS 962.96) TaxID=1314807 RepID=A0A4S8MI20_DENBC|nr:hypothetical protein K435DRAFT_383472 [Dendrothele bispora CBS 962.96]